MNTRNVIVIIQQLDEAEIEKEIVTVQSIDRAIERANNALYEFSATV